MPLKIRVVPKITWTKEGDYTVATGLVEIVIATKMEEILESIPIRSQLKIKKLTPEEALSFFQRDLIKKINRVLEDYKIKEAIDNSFVDGTDDLEKTVQIFLNDNIDLNGLNCK